MKTIFFATLAIISTSIYASAGQLIDLGLMGGKEAHAQVISDDGSAVAGNFIDTKGIWHIFRWTKTEGIQDLGTVHDAKNGGGAYVVGMSADESD